MNMRNGLNIASIRSRTGLGALLCIALLASGASAARADCIILLHGLARSADAMTTAQEYFEEQGYAVANVDYPSREHTVEVLAPMAVEQGLRECPKNDRVHFLTHSMGGILVRYYLQDNSIENLGRVVMLAPPNNGSEVVDNLRDVPGFEAFNGPAGMQLGTDRESIPMQLGKVEFELGIIAGDFSVNPLLSLNLPNPDDGKVSVESAKVEGMTDFIVVPYSHTFIMNADEVLQQAQNFIENGKYAASKEGGSELPQDSE